MEIKERNINELISAEYNPRKLSQEQYSHLKDSLTRFGVVDPVIVNKHPDRLNIIVGGHQRCRVWQEMGNEPIPTVEVELTPEKERELNIRLNKNSGEFDFELLQEHFNTEDLVEWGIDEQELLGSDSENEQNITAEVEFSEFLNEENNYVVLFFDNDIDWLQAQTHFNLKTVSSKRANGNEWSKGVGRVINGADYFNKLNDGI